MKRINELILRTRNIPREFYDSVSYDEYIHTKNSEEAPTQKRPKESQKNKKYCKQYVNKKEIINEQEDISLFNELNNDESSKSRLRDVRKRNKLNEERRKDIEKITQNNYIIQSFEDQVEKKENDNNSSNNNENDSSTELEYFKCIDSSKEKKPRKKTPKKKNVREVIKSLQNKKTKRSYKEQIKYFEEIEKRVNQQSLTKVYPHFQKKETSFIQIVSDQNDNNNVNDTHEIIDLNADDGIDLENNEIVINPVIPEMSLLGINEMKENQKNYRDNDNNEQHYINIDYISHVPAYKHARSRSNSREKTKRSYSKEGYENYERRNDKECSKILLADKEMWEEFKEFLKFKQMLQQEENNKQEIFEKELTESYRNNYYDDKCQTKDGSLYDPSSCKQYSLSEQSRKPIITNEDINSIKVIERRKRRRMKYYW
ncbi:hypothetical protein EHI8A_039120 [Entamoeba histolytica HM-1:IMSS-B]|uniref:Uncharacterized protein n=1 Tax=Entamoeba histolytica HM-1:IMSS-B TaxID=885319 RepID=M3UQ83_ENTH1|nr:hypothetical protein EHI8A_039120 [Entamoeba histolytica HM-1:IMSS-B]